MYCKIVFLCSRPSEKRGNRQFHVVIIIAKAPIKSTVDSMIRKPPLPPPPHTHTQAPPAKLHERLTSIRTTKQGGREKKRDEKERTQTKLNLCCH